MSIADRPFDLDLVDLSHIKRKNINGKRYYYQEDAPEPVYYPSVTTVIGSDTASKKSLFEWRDRVGAEVADSIGRRAARRGSGTHKLIEAYLLNKDFESKYEQATQLEKILFEPLRKWANENIEIVRCVEGQLFSHHLRSAGTVDTVAVVKGRHAVIDWKSVSRIKNRSHIDNYFKQEAAYAVMFEENTGIPVPDIITVMTSEEMEFAAYTERRNRWIGEYITLREAMS